MSISSTTHTFALQPALLDAYSESSHEDPWSIASEWKEESGFGAGAGRAYTHSELHSLIRHWRPGGIDYLDAVQPNGYYSNQPQFMTALQGERLAAAIAGLHSLISHPTRSLEETFSVVPEDGDLSLAEAFGLDAQPASIAAAQQSYDHAMGRSGGEDSLTTLAFLRGHLSVLLHAQRHALAAVYLRWIE